MKITLERRFFIINSTGDSEFDWYLKELGIPQKKWDKIDSVTLDAKIIGIES